MIPSHNGPDLQEDRGKPKYDYVRFMDKLLTDNDDRVRSNTSPGSGKMVEEKFPKKSSNGFH